MTPPPIGSKPALMASRGRLALLTALLGGALALPLHGCGEEAPDTGGVDDLGTLEAKADQPALREVTLTVAAGANKWYRIKATGFLATLSQSGQVQAQLSAKHQSLESEGLPSKAPELTVEGDGTLRNWTLRVINLGTLPLVARLRVEGLPSMPATGPEIGLVSDIDKTVLPPETAAGLPHAYPGVAKLYSTLELRQGGKAGDMYYVTARTPDRLGDVRDWMKAEGLPAGPIETGLSGIPAVAEKAKIEDVSKIFDAHPEQKFVLFGDSNHRDPEVYRAISAKYPGRVLAVFINDVKAIDPARLDGLNLIAHYGEAAALLYGQGLLTETEARDVMESAREGGLALSQADEDALIAAHRP